MHLDSDQLTLHFPTEEHPRQLRCGIVKGDAEVPQMASEQEMYELFGPDAPHEECNNEDEEENNEGAHDDDDDEKDIEKDALGGDEGFEHDADKFSDENSMPADADGNDDDVLQQDLEDLIAGEHADKFDVWTIEIDAEDIKAEASLHNADGDHSGLYTTDKKEKLLLPFVEGVKLQQRGTFDATKCSAGFQIWYGKTSKWFSYGPAKGAQFKTQYDAYQAVLDWVWGKHAGVVGHEAASASRAKNIGKYGKANAPY